MNILVLNGSPKGAYSVTLQTSLWLEKKYPEHSFTVLHAGQQIKGLERDFSPARKAVEEADLLLFSYPVYTFLAPSQLHRFFELLKEHCLYNSKMVKKRQGFRSMKDEFTGFIIETAEKGKSVRAWVFHGKGGMEVTLSGRDVIINRQQ